VGQTTTKNKRDSKRDAKKAAKRAAKKDARAKRKSAKLDKTKTKANTKAKKARTDGVISNKFLLYERAVQCVEADLDFAEKVFKKKFGRPFTSMREDFCGTAALAASWVERGEDHTAIGVDLHQPTLDEGMKRNVSRLGDAAERVTLLCEDVRTVVKPKVDVVNAFNFSYWIFKARKDMVAYFKAVRKSIKPEGLFMLDVFGGTEGMTESKDTRTITTGKTPDGTKVARFRYTWDQARFNPVNHDFLCHIHFELSDGKKLKKAFSYDWRFWTVGEIREALAEAGFDHQDVYMDDWDDDEDDTNGIYKKRKYFDNDGCWVGYIVAYA